MKKIRCALYVCTNKDNQDWYGGTLEKQTKLLIQKVHCLNKAAAANGDPKRWKITEIYRDEECHDNSSNHRSFGRMYDAVLAEEIDAVLVVRLDCFSKSMSEIIQIMARFEEEGVQLISLTEVFDSHSTQGILFTKFLTGLSHYERECASARMRELKAKRTKGREAA